MGVFLSGTTEPPKIETGTDEDIEQKTIELWSLANNILLKKKGESEEVNEIRQLLRDVKANLRKYKETKTAKAGEDALDAAFEAASEAYSKAKSIEGWLGTITSLLGVCISLIFFVWLPLHGLLGWLWISVLFYWDAFFIALVGATMASILYLGGKGVRKARTNMTSAFATLIASPFIAVVLIMLFSELTIGIGNELAADASSNVGLFTLRAASDGLKMAFAFLFGFFDELSIDLLKRIINQIIPQSE